MKRVYAGIFLISLATLSLEVTLTRIISVKLYYHFSYLIISVALLGYGAAGAYVASSRRFRDDSSQLPLGACALLFAITATGTPLVAGRIPFQAFPLVLSHPVQLISVVLYYLLLFVPFFFAGMVISMALKQYRGEVNRLYFFDLAGAGLACLLVVFAIRGLGGPGALALTSALGAGGSMLLAGRSGAASAGVRWLVLAAAVAGMVIFAVYQPQVIKTAKGRIFLKLSSPSMEVSEEYDYTRWGALTRVDVTPEKINPPLIIMMGREHSRKLYRMRVILQDLQAPTPMYRFDGDFKKLSFLPHHALAAAYIGKRNPEVLIIGPGGGSGVMVALNEGASRVVAAEINPLICKVVTEVYPNYINNLYSRPNVKLVNAEGRSYMARSPEKFDVIEMTLVDTFAALSSGAYSLSENYLYTVDAFEEVLEHLKPDGVLVCSRNIFSPPRESLRLLSIAVEALSRKNIKPTQKHFFIFSTVSPGTMNTGIMLLKKDGFSRVEAERVESFCRNEGFRVIYNPYGEANNPFAYYAKSDDAAREVYRRRYYYNITASTDDKPFFFQYFRWSQLLDPKLWKFGPGKGNVEHRFPLGHLILLVSLLQATLLSVVFIVWPLWKARKSAPGSSEGGSAGALIYFASLGAAFMAVEIVLMQKLMVFLGYPLRSLTVVLFALLLSSGTGSAVSRRWRGAPLKVIGLAVAAIVLLIPVELYVTEVVFPHLMGLPSGARFAVSAAAIFPLGFVMGMPFPLGISYMGNKNPDLIPWYWGINACFSVISSLATVILSMSFGFRIAMLIAAAVYLVGYAGIRRGSQKLQTSRS